MKKIISIFIIISIMIPSLSKAAFYDIEYGPDSTGMADYTEQDAENNAKKQNEAVQNSTSPENYVGKSNNNYLKNLYVEDGTMSPEFNRQYVDYKVTLKDENLKKINIVAEAEDEKATIKGAGEVELNNGENDIQVVVTAENGNVQIYDLKIELPYEQSEYKLESLDIKGVNIETGENENVKIKPSFQSDKYEYTLDVSYNISQLIVDAKASDDANISIKGADSLVIGVNKVKIQIESNSDSSKTTTYIITVNRGEEEKNSSQNKRNYIIYIIIVLIIIILLAIILKKNKKQKTSKH